MSNDTVFAVASERQRKVASVLHRELTSILQFKISDPRIVPITIVEVEVSRDLKFAKVYATASSGDSLKATLEILNQAKGYIRSALSEQVKLKHTPDLLFVADRILERGNRVLGLINDVSKPVE